MPSKELSSTYGVEQAPHENASIFTVLRRRALIILVVMLLAGGASAAVVYLKSDTYESTAKLLFRQTIGPELNAIGLLPGAPDADNLAADNVEVTASRRRGGRDLGRAARTRASTSRRTTSRTT